MFPLSPQIPALRQEDVLQELVLEAGRPPDPGELFLLPLDQSWCFLVGKSPAGFRGTPGSKGGVKSIRSQIIPQIHPR